MRLYLDVPYQEKDRAKALGAKWDAKVKKWYTDAERKQYVKFAPLDFERWGRSLHCHRLSAYHRGTPRLLEMQKTDPGHRPWNRGICPYL